jgi:hypothetical protein
MDMTAFEFLKELHTVCHFQTREGRKVGKASSNELKRWFDNGAVVINGKRVGWRNEVAFPITSMVLFPKNPVTLAYLDTWVKTV